MQYITARLATGEWERLADKVGLSPTTITKRALDRLAKSGDLATADFVSASIAHQDGRHFRAHAALVAYGSPVGTTVQVTVNLRYDADRKVATILFVTDDVTNTHPVVTATVS